MAKKFKLHVKKVKHLADKTNTSKVLNQKKTT